MMKKEDFYLVVLKNEEVKKFKKRIEVEKFLKKHFDLTNLQVKEFFRRGNKISRKFGVEIFKLTWETKPPCKRHKSSMLHTKIIWRTGFTDIEELMFEGLKNLGFKEDEDFIVQYSIEGKKGNKYILDFAFPKEKLDIECDGEYWHEECKNSAEDKERDEFLKSKGWYVLRFRSKEIKENLSEVLETIRSKVKELNIRRQDKEI